MADIGHGSNDILDSRQRTVGARPQLRLCDIHLRSTRWQRSRVVWASVAPAKHLGHDRMQCFQRSGDDTTLLYIAIRTIQREHTAAAEVEAFLARVPARVVCDR